MTTWPFSPRLALALCDPIGRLVAPPSCVQGRSDSRHGRATTGGALSRTSLHLTSFGLTRWVAGANKDYQWTKVRIAPSKLGARNGVVDRNGQSRRRIRVRLFVHRDGQTLRTFCHAQDSLVHSGVRWHWQTPGNRKKTGIEPGNCQVINIGRQGLRASQDALIGPRRAELWGQHTKRRLAAGTVIHLSRFPSIVCGCPLLSVVPASKFSPRARDVQERRGILVLFIARYHPNPTGVPRSSSVNLGCRPPHAAVCQQRAGAVQKTCSIDGVWIMPTPQIVAANVHRPFGDTAKTPRRC